MWENAAGTPKNVGCLYTAVRRNCVTLRHFEIFRAVAETESFTKAAKRLFITQSAVSHAIREIEEEAGTIFLERNAKNVRLNQSGRLLLAEILPILSSCEKLQENIKNIENEAVVRLVSSITVASFWLPEILKRFRKEWPDTLVETQVVSAAAAMEVLGEGHADMALIEGASCRQPGYIYECFSSYKMVFLCSESYPLDKEMLTVSELLAHPLLLREKGSAVRDTLDSALTLKGYSAKPLWTSVNSQALMEAAAAGLGITLLPEPVYRLRQSGTPLRKLYVEGVELANDTMLVYHKNKFISRPLDSLRTAIRQTDFY